MSIAPAMSVAGCDRKTAPTSTISPTAKRRMKRRAPLPRYSPAISGRLAPRCRSDMNPDSRSCMPPMKMPPSVIHTKATGP